MRSVSDRFQQCPSHSPALILQAVLIFVTASGVFSREPPRILATDTDDQGAINIPVSSTLSLNCEGEEPVRWKTHGRKDIAKRLIEESSDKPDVDKKFQSTIVVSDTVYTDTGYFTCRYQDSMDSEAPENGVQIYVFVNDPSNVMLPADGIHFLSVHQNMESIIPCLPTSRRVNVTLWKGTPPSAQHQQTNGFDLVFDPTRGFIVSWPPITFSGEFYCMATLESVSSRHVFYLSWLPSTDVVPTPNIQTQFKFATKGAKFMLDCSVRSTSAGFLFLDWNYPAQNDVERIKIGQVWSTEFSRGQGEKYVETKRNLTITTVTDDDQGTYTCTAKDHNGKTNQKAVYLEVKVEGDAFIKFSLGAGDPNEAFEQMLGAPEVKFAVSVESYPSTPELRWYKDDLQLSNSNKYKISNTLKMSILEIYNLARSDTGFYTLVGKIGSTMEELKLTLMIVEPPDVSIRPKPLMYSAGAPFFVKCHVEGCPGSNITWMWSPCSSPKSCKRNYETLTGPVKNEELETGVAGEILNGCHVQSILTGNLNVAGYYKCFAENNLGKNASEVPLFIKEFKDNMGISASDATPFEQDRLDLSCYASTFQYSTMQWFWVPKGPEPIRKIIANSSNTLVKISETKYTQLMDVSINPVVIDSTGEYVCHARVRDSNTWDEKRIKISVERTIAPTIVETNLNNTEYTVFKEVHFEFVCKSSGVPSPDIRWYLNGSLIQAINDTAVQFLENKSKLYIARTLPSDSGRYICEAANRAGVAIRNATLKVLDVESKSALSKGGIIGIVVFIIAAIVTIIVGGVFLGRRVYHERKAKFELEELQQQLFHQGDVGSYNPELPLDEQIDALPYDRSWEIPKENLRLGRVLGQGAFGRVLKGDVHHLFPGQEWTTVAVKMLKERADNEQRKALMQELKIMIHIGKHMNVVNLLGAVTKNLCKGELQVLVEYCKYGNLRHFLLKHRDSFIDQINTTTGEYDPAVERTGNVFRFSEMYNNSGSNSTRTELTGATVDSGGGVDNVAARLSGLASPAASTARQLSTYDLICYCYQISSGMIYLVSKKLVHRDLALRNILLADGDIVKICDFGLAKNVYKKDYYRKKGQGPLPYKWMAIESMRDKVYTTESDVWSFGILLWEIYTLGANPYPGLEVDDEFYNKLNNGYRMEKPQLAPNTMYSMMQKCWQYEPRERPNFQDINTQFSALLDPETVENYCQLNADYLKRDLPFGHNSSLLTQLANDMEAYVSADPEGQQQQNYVNTDITPDQSPVRVNLGSGNVNYVNLLHPNDSNGLNHQRALKYGERGNDRPELAPMIGSGHYQNPPPTAKGRMVNNLKTAGDGYLDMGSKQFLNDDEGPDKLTVRDPKAPTRSSPPPRYTEVINSDQLNDWNS